MLCLLVFGTRAAGILAVSVGTEKEILNDEILSK